MIKEIKKELKKVIDKETDEAVLMQIYHFMLDCDVVLKGDKGRLFEIEKYHKLTNFRFFEFLKEKVALGSKTAVLPYSKKYIINIENMMEDDFIEFEGGVTSTKIIDKYTIKDGKIIIELDNYKFWNYLFD